MCILCFMSDHAVFARYVVFELVDSVAVHHANHHASSRAIGVEARHSHRSRNLILSCCAG